MKKMIIVGVLVLGGLYILDKVVSGGGLPKWMASPRGSRTGQSLKVINLTSDLSNPFYSPNVNN